MPKEIVAIPIGRIAHETMSQRVYGELRELIMSGRLQPGQTGQNQCSRYDLGSCKVCEN